MPISTGDFSMVFSHNANKARRKLEARRRRHQKMREKCTEITKDNDLELVVPTDEQVISELASLKFFEGSAGWRGHGASSEVM